MTPGRLERCGDETALRKALLSLLPEGFGVGVRGLGEGEPLLHPEEIRWAEIMVPKRRREFAAGRQAARDALRDLGLPERAIGRARTGAPLWPPGLVGSIAHDATWAVAVLAPQAQCRSIGIDIEESGAVDPDLWPDLFTRFEREDLGRLPPDSQAPAASALFGIKEAYFKFQHPLTGAWLDFKDVEVRARDEGYRLSVRGTDPGLDQVSSERIGCHVIALLRG